MRGGRGTGGLGHRGQRLPVVAVLVAVTISDSFGA